MRLLPIVSSGLGFRATILFPIVSIKKDKHHSRQSYQVASGMRIRHPLFQALEKCSQVLQRLVAHNPVGHLHKVSRVSKVSK